MSAQTGRLRRIDETGVPSLVARLVVGIAFILMGYNKAIAPYDFLKLLREYGIFAPEQYVLMNFVAIVLPWMEILWGALLVAGVAVRGTALIILTMMVSFTVLVIMRAIGIYQAASPAIAFCSIEFDCGCGNGVVNICWKIVENTALTLLALLLVWSRTTLVITNLLAPKKTSVR